MNPEPQSVATPEGGRDLAVGAMAGASEVLADVCRTFDVPGAVVGVLSEGTIEVFAHGVTNLNNGHTVDVDTLFQVGSITKTLTATAIMALAFRNGWDLYAPIGDLALPAPGAPQFEDLTLAQLLTHTSGLPGDLFPDTGRGDDCISRYVELLEHADARADAGGIFSYCNSGYVLLGHLIERATSLTWDEALRELVLDPLGMWRTVTLPEEALLHSVAVGHGPDARGVMTPSGAWTYPRAIGPAGLACSTAGDMLRFAAAHLRDGAAEQLIGPTNLQLMHGSSVAVPGRWPGDDWGLGWIGYDWDGTRALGHDGGTIGQRALLRVVPDRDVAVVVLTNATSGALAARRVLREAMSSFGLNVPTLPEPTPSSSASRADLRRHEGVYSRPGETWTVTTDESQRGLAAIVATDITDLVPATVTRLALEPVDPDRYLVRTRSEPDMVITFDPDRAANPRHAAWLFNGRINRRQGSA